MFYLLSIWGVWTLRETSVQKNNRTMFKHVPHGFWGLACFGEHVWLMTTPTLKVISCSNVHLYSRKRRICFLVLCERIFLMFLGTHILIDRWPDGCFLLYSCIKKSVDDNKEWCNTMDWHRTHHDGSLWNSKQKHCLDTDVLDLYDWHSVCTYGDWDI
jgi:hypothetical protein